MKILDSLLNHTKIDETANLFFSKFWEYIKKKDYRNQINKHERKTPDKQILEKIMLNLFCETNINVNIAKNLEDSPLIYFTNLRSTDVVKLLISVKADVNHVGRRGMTALHHAVMGKVLTLNRLNI